MTISKLIKIAESFPIGKKMQWEKEKLLVKSNFSFSHSVFKILALSTHKSKGLCEKKVNFSTNNKIKTTISRLLIGWHFSLIDQNSLWEKEKMLVIHTIYWVKH